MSAKTPQEAAVPLLVVSPGSDTVEAINGLLRRAGVAAHCTWVEGAAELPTALAGNPDTTLLLVATTDDDIGPVATARDQAAPDLPLVVVRTRLDENQLEADLARGACDTVSLARPARLQAVIQRELRARRIQEALDATLRTAQDSRQQLDTVLRRSNDAIAQVQEGILIDANGSWLEILGYERAEQIAGQPVMDLFDPASQPTLRGALIACQGGRWSGHGINVDAIRADGSRCPLELNLAAGEHDGEPSVRLVVPAPRREERHLADDLSAAVHRDPRTGLPYRQPLLESIAARFGAPLPGGRRFLLCISPDHFTGIEHDLGVLGSDDFVRALAQLVKSQLLPNDLLGHYSGTGLMALLERGTERDAEAWAERLIDRVSREELSFDGKSVRATVTVGLAFVPNSTPRLDPVAQDALDAVRRGRLAGGNQLFAYSRAESDTRVQSHDVVWIKIIKAALMEDRFRLVQQPIASLQGHDAGMADVLVRMLDPNGTEVLPSEFLPPAERNDLLKNIDRWVLSAALRQAANRGTGCLFVRLSGDSVVDATLLPWLDAQIQAIQVDPATLCIQITEEVALRHLQEVRRLATALRERRLRVALEHLGVAEGAASLLDQVPADFAKIDGSLMQGLKENRAAQDRIAELAAAAQERNIPTIAERVEDANTMAILWQLGIHHVQGFFLQQPEDVVLADG
ncbi:MAG: hypothetical protein RLZZ393_1617 [Pseudomonadota bacterium]